MSAIQQLYGNFVFMLELDLTKAQNVLNHLAACDQDCAPCVGRNWKQEFGIH